MARANSPKTQISIQIEAQIDQTKTPRTKASDDRFFTGVLATVHPLCQEIVRSVVLPRPGIYLITDPSSKKVLYVGRSTRNLATRLTQHARNRNYHGFYFSFVYAKNAIDSYRLECRAIFYFNRIYKLTNQIHAAIP